MNLSQASLAMLLSTLIITTNSTYFTGVFSINCASTAASVARSGRKWLGESQPEYSSLLQIRGLSTSSTVIPKSTSIDPVPYKTARLSRSRFSYIFKVNPGQKIFRFHFNPTPYRGFKGSKDLFAVEAGPYILLSSFSASLTGHALGVDTFAKEFCLTIQENQQLNITIIPQITQSLDTFAFVNGIEIISVPASLSYFHGEDIELQVVGGKSLIYVDNNTALEIVQNIKHDSSPLPRDSSDIFPKWATEKADEMASNSWEIAVEVGFKYLIRLHFSELGLKIARTSDVMFRILINERIAHSTTDLAKERDGNKVPRYKDYIVTMRGQKREGKRHLLISLQSYDEFIVDGYGLLTGFEIVKLSNTDNSLASTNSFPPAHDPQSKSIGTLHFLCGQRNTIATIVVTIICLVNIIVHKMREFWEASRTDGEEHKLTTRAERLCRRFTLAEILLATRNFSDGLVIGRGGFGKLYKGLIGEGQTTVAIKRLKSNSRQGAHEFVTEIETLSQLHHVNLVSLIGYCSERREMILVYEYMALGTLADRLYKHPWGISERASLTWKQRLNISIGAGRGLDYLHTGHGVIHRDVKASNILLDESFVAKVSDFGLAKLEDRSKLKSHVTTKVKGTFGYLDPHYFSTRKLARKSDTYAFGAHLLEVLCGRAAVDSSVPEDERILMSWARDKISKGEVDQIAAPSIREEISPNSLKTFVGIAERCLDDEPKNRPTMSQIVLQLELALEQQESNQELVLKEIATASDEIGQSTMVSTVPYPPNEQSNSKVVSSEVRSATNVWRKAAIHWQTRLWLLEAFWKRTDPTKENELLSSGKPRRWRFKQNRVTSEFYHLHM